MKLSPEEYREYIKTGKLPGEKPKKKSKYGNKKVNVDGEVIHSKLEAKHVKGYRLLLRAGEILAYGRQIEFMLPGGVKYIVDHLIYHKDKTWEAVDSKGVETKEFKIKAKLFKETYPDIKFTVRTE